MKDVVIMAKPIKACTTKQNLKRPIKRVFRAIYTSSTSNYTADK